MISINVGRLVKTSQKTIIDHAPAILTAVGITGTVATAVLAAKASFVARDRIVDAQNISETALTRQQMIEKCWTLYMPAVGVGTITVVSIFMSHKINAQRIATLATAYALKDKAYEEYKEQAKKILGDKKAGDISQKSSEERVARIFEEQNDTEFIPPAEGTVLFMDSISGRVFTSTQEIVRKAINDVNEEIFKNGYVSLSEFWDKIGLRETRYGNGVGWNTECALDAAFNPVRVTIRDVEYPVFDIVYDTEPLFGFDRVHA